MLASGVKSRNDLMPKWSAKSFSRVAEDENLGFVIVPSRKISLFANLRDKIVEDLGDDTIPSGMLWKFYIPETGLPVSKKQERGLGPLYPLLQRALEGCAGGCHPFRIAKHVRVNAVEAVIADSDNAFTAYIVQPSASCGCPADWEIFR